MVNFIYFPTQHKDQKFHVLRMSIKYV